MWLIAIASEMKTLNVGSRMVEDALGSEVVEAGLLGLEFKADQ
jgi:hypothetical protein